MPVCLTTGHIREETQMAIIKNHILGFTLPAIDRYQADQVFIQAQQCYNVSYIGWIRHFQHLVVWCLWGNLTENLHFNEHGLLPTNR